MLRIMERRYTSPSAIDGVKDARRWLGSLAPRRVTQDTCHVQAFIYYLFLEHLEHHFRTVDSTSSC